MAHLVLLTSHPSRFALVSAIALALGLMAAITGRMPLAGGSIATNPHHAQIGIAPVVVVAGEASIASQRLSSPRSRHHVIPAPRPHSHDMASSPWAVLLDLQHDRVASDLPRLRPPRGGREFLIEMASWRHASVTPRTPPMSSSCCPR